MNQSSSEVTESFENMEGGTPQEKQQAVWEAINARNGSECPVREWPGYDTVLSHMDSADYNHTLQCPLDLLSGAEAKTLCPFGVVCCAELEIFPDSPYTGLLAETSPFCLLRLSTAIRPPSSEVKSRLARTLLYTLGEKLRTAQLFPVSALKVFTTESSRNLLFGGSKLGQRETDYFAHCQSTTMTERMPRPVKPFVRKFWQYSDYPLSLGISDFCRTAQGVTDAAFPFCVTLKPVLDKALLDSNATAEKDSFDAFVDETLAVPVGTALFDLYTCPKPAAVADPSKLERIGRIRTTSQFVKSHASDGIFFKHQLKEDDYKLRPEWPKALKDTVSLDGGSVKGTIGTLTGWKLFEQHIAEGRYKDYEIKATS